MRRTLQIAWTYVRLGVLNEMQYRANFFVAIVQSLLGVAVAIAVLALVYSKTDSLHGWSQSELLVVLGIQILLGGVIHASVQPNMERLTDDVRDGKLDFALTKPADAQLLISLRELRLWQLVDVLSGAIVVAVGISRLQTTVGIGHAVAFLVLLGLGASLLYCFWLVLATGSFWVVNMWFLSDLFEGVYQVGRWPIGVYPGWLRYSMTYLVPIGFAITVPAQAVTGRLGWSTVVIAVVFSIVVFAIARRFWRYGLSKYSGASA
jgi:viologen exporter family transport system permease protein